MPAPFTGILLSSDMVNDLRKAVIERDAIKLQNDSLNKIVTMQDDNFLHQQSKVTILLQQNDLLAERLNDSQSMNNWEKVGLVSLGIIAALVGAYGFKQVTK